MLRGGGRPGSGGAGRRRRPTAAAEALPRGARAVARARARRIATTRASLRREATRLEELRWGALEDRIDADLQRGRDVELVAELEQLVGEAPLRERLHGFLMLALYRAGRQAEALRAYQHAREVLGEELGLDPGPELQALESAILAHDPTLDAASGRRRPRRPDGGPTSTPALSRFVGRVGRPRGPRRPGRRTPAGDDRRAGRGRQDAPRPRAGRTLAAIDDDVSWSSWRRSATRTAVTDAIGLGPRASPDGSRPAASTGWSSTSATGAPSWSWTTAST